MLFSFGKARELRPEVLKIIKLQQQVGLFLILLVRFINTYFDRNRVAIWEMLYLKWMNNSHNICSMYYLNPSVNSFHLFVEWSYRVKLVINSYIILYHYNGTQGISS